MDSRVRCPHCGSHVEVLAYCGVCGRPLPHDNDQAAAGWQQRLLAQARSLRHRPVDGLVALAGVLAFLLLLAGLPALAVIALLILLPAAGVLALSSLDLYEQESRLVTGGLLIAAAVISLVAAILTTLIFNRFWFHPHGLNLGAVGFVGSLSRGESGVSFGVLLFNGIIVPLLAGIALFGLPIVSRRSPSFRNEIMDGLTLGGFAAAAFAVISGVVYFWPSLGSELPDRPVSGWTAALAGIVIVRPVVLICAGSLVGWTTWQYLTTRNLQSLVIPAVAGVIGWFGLSIGSLLLATANPVLELVWYVVVLAIVGVSFRNVVLRGRATDRQVLAAEEGEQRVVCPNCHRVTPDGRYCAFCGAPLHPEEEPAAGTDGDTAGHGAKTVTAGDESDAPQSEPVMAAHQRSPEGQSSSDGAHDVVARDGMEDVEPDEARLDDDGGPAPSAPIDAVATGASPAPATAGQMTSDADTGQSVAKHDEPPPPVGPRIAWQDSDSEDAGAAQDAEPAAVTASAGGAASDGDHIGATPPGDQPTEEEPDAGSTRVWVLGGPTHPAPTPDAAASASVPGNATEATGGHDVRDRGPEPGAPATPDSAAASDERSSMPLDAVDNGEPHNPPTEPGSGASSSAPSQSGAAPLAGQPPEEGGSGSVIEQPATFADTSVSGPADGPIPGTRPTPPGMRWFRGGDTTPQAAAETETPDSPDEAISAPEADHTEPVASPEGTDRWGAWRQMTRRVGNRSAPDDAHRDDEHRDPDDSDEETRGR